MATLQKIRNRAGLLIVVIGVALLAFIIGDGLRSGGTLFQMSNNYALKIDGEKIKAEDYHQRLQELQEASEANGNHLSDEQRMQLNNQLAEEYIQSIALEKEADALGIEVTPEELLALVLGDGVAPAPQAQQFISQMGINPNDRNAVQSFLEQITDNQIAQLPAEQQGQLRMIKNSWDALLRSLRNERISSKFNAIMTRSYAINKVDAQFLSETPSRDVAVVRTPSTLLTDTTVRATDEEVRAYYDKHPRMFEQKYPFTRVEYINVAIRPSAKYYASALSSMNQTRASLLSAVDAKTVTRNHSEAFAPEFYMSAKELRDANFPSTLVEFIEANEAGAVNTPAIENDSYSLVKVLAKKSAPEGLHARIIVLDSVGTAKADSIVGAINGGAAFADMATRYSVDPQTKAQGGYIIFKNQMGMADTTLTEAMATSQGLDTLYKASVGQAFVSTLGTTKVVLQVAKALPAVAKYKIAYINLPITFSEETFSEKYSTINNILASDKSFDEMAKDAEAKGLEVVRDARVEPSSITLANIPSSREVVSWLLKAKPGDVNEKVFRCGDANLVVATVKEQVPAGLQPLDDVKEQIRDYLTMEKRGDKLASDLAAKKIAGLEGYVVSMQSTVDTIANVSLVARGAVTPMLAAHAMTTAINSVSKPFRSGTEVIVVKPLREIKTPVGQSQQAQLQQQRRALGQGLGYRAFQQLMRDMEIVDNRAKFF